MWVLPLQVASQLPARFLPSETKKTTMFSGLVVGVMVLTVSYSAPGPFPHLLKNDALSQPYRIHKV